MICSFEVSRREYSIDHVIDQGTRKLIGGRYRNSVLDLILKQNACYNNNNGSDDDGVLIASNNLQLNFLPYSMVSSLYAKKEKTYTICLVFYLNKNNDNMKKKKIIEGTKSDDFS